MEDLSRPIKLQTDLSSSASYDGTAITAITEISSSATDSDDPEARRRTILKTYCEVEKEFFSWEQQMCMDAITSLHRESSGLSSLLAEEYPLDVVSADDYMCDGLETRDGDKSVVTYMNRGQVRNVKVVKRSFTAPRLEQFPTYESCTPSTISLGPRRYQVPHDETLSFIPYADDKNFDWQKFVGFHKWFAWTNNADLDPDIEQIQFETARRLLVDYGMDIASIDAANSKCLPLLREHEQYGLLWRNTQRDSLPWVEERLKEKGVAGPISEIYPNKYKIPASDVKGRLESMNKEFCSNLNCIGIRCRTHTPSEPNPSGFEPKLTSDELLHTIESPCGEKCTKNATAEQLDEVVWDKNTVDLLEEILKVCADTSPCKLAYTVRKPCYEVFAHRRWLVLDDKVLAAREADLRKPLAGAQIAKGKMNVVGKPCRHPGQCGKNLNCSCWEAGVYCQRTCWCDSSCVQQWKGCNCGSKGAKHNCKFGQNRCPCVKAYRECDPELCKSCGSAKSHGKRKPSCMNSSFQHGKKKRLKIKPAKYGYGAFLMGSVDKRHELIGEYVGRIIEEEEDTEALDFLNKYRGRNYTFNVGGRVLDAFTIANETRFPNHGEPGAKELNCYCREFLVNGEYRMGIFSNRPIQRGEEILFDYGEDFFLDK